MFYPGYMEANDVMRAVGLGIQEFEKIRNGNLFYVDKTGFISDWYKKSDDITLITRPRRFGKTLTMDMLNCFFSASYAGRADLFEGLAVSRDPDMMKLQGTVPTIKISFSSVKGDSFDSFLIAMTGRIARLLKHYRYLLNSDALTEDEKDLFRKLAKAVPDIPDRINTGKRYLEFLYGLTHILQSLSGWLSEYHGKKVYIFMDEYDTPLQAAYIHHYYDDAIAIMREMFSETFKENEYLGRAVITGITRIAKESLFSEMNNLAVCSVISGGYDKAFGFTKQEMDSILEEYGLTDKKELVQFWYDGFTAGHETEIYNPWSVINYLSRKDYPPEDYWAKSGGVSLIDSLLRRSGTGLKEGFEDLLAGGVIERRIREDLIFPQLDRDENAVWSLLIAAGYVKPVPENSLQNSDADYLKPLSMTEPDLPKTRISLTNYETMLCLYELVKGWFTSDAGNYMENFAQALLADDLPEMNRQMRQVILLCGSFFDTGTKPSEGNTAPENFFHALTLGILTCLSGSFFIKSNRESGFGRFDVMLAPKCPERNPDAFLLEFKVYSKKAGDRSVEDTALRARQQIDDKKYCAELQERGITSDRIRKYGFGFRGKEVVIVG